MPYKKVASYNFSMFCFYDFVMNPGFILFYVCCPSRVTFFFFDLEGTIIEDASDPAAATKGIIISPYLMPGYHI
jgi:hypothetical protein